MTQVRLTGWTEGFQKVKMSQLLRDECGLGLAGAKEVVDRILDGGEAELTFPSVALAETFVTSAAELGARIELDECG